MIGLQVFRKRPTWLGGKPRHDDIADLTSLSRRAQRFIASGSPDLALDLLKQEIPRRRNSSAFWLVAATTLEQIGHQDRAIQCYRNAIAIDPTRVEALVGLCLRLSQSLDWASHQGEVRSLAERALLIDPSSTEALIFSVQGAMLTADLSNRSLLVDRIRHFIDLGPGLWYLIRAAYWAPFLDIDYELERRIWATIEKTINREARAVARHDPSRARTRPKLRIGYASPNFGNHPIGHVTKSLYRTHDRERFEVYLYSIPRLGDDTEYATCIRETCDKYTDISRMDIETVRARIMEDEVDILVDLNGYMGTTKFLEIFSGRPAPVQVYWLGHAGALGLSFYDYVIGDAIVTPPEEDRLYSEAIARLPDTFHPTDRHEIAGEYGTRGDYGLEANAVVFCGFCSPTKIDPEVFQAWMQILGAVPGSQLWLWEGGNPLVESNLSRAAEEQGISKERLVFDERIADKRRHLGRLRLADLFLDTFTVNASTIAIDALWAGLPILTRPGRHFCSRNCSSFLRAVGLEDMVCGTTAEYISRAVCFGTNPDAVTAVKDRLWKNRESYPLFEIKSFTGHLEHAYQMMWERWLSGKPPASFSC